MDFSHQTEQLKDTQTAGVHPSVDQGVDSKKVCRLELATCLALLIDGDYRYHKTEVLEDFCHSCSEFNLPSELFLGC